MTTSRPTAGPVRWVAVLTFLLAALMAPTTWSGSAAAGERPTATTGPAARAAVAAPKLTLSIPRINRGSIPVRPVSVRRGVMQVPTNAHVLGWWRGSAPWGATSGSSIVIGHVSGESDAPGALYDLHQVRKGDRIVWAKGGKKKVFKVIAKTYTSREGNLPDRIWLRSGPRRLHLVTCARKVTSADGYYHYTHNLTVTARPVKGTK